MIGTRCTAKLIFYFFKLLAQGDDSKILRLLIRFAVCKLFQILLAHWPTTLGTGKSAKKDNHMEREQKRMEINKDT